MTIAALLVLLVLYQIDESGDGTGDESGDDTKDSVSQGKVNYAGTFPLQGVITDIYCMPVKTLATRSKNFVHCKSS